MHAEKAKAAAQKQGSQHIERPYKKNMQKQFLCRQIRDRLRKEFWAMYRSAESAYASMDFEGTGYITERAFLDSIVVSSRLPFTTDQVKMYFDDYNLFGKGSPGLNFDVFKKNFFPHLYLV